MSLRVAVAAPFREKGGPSMPESEFVVALSLDRDWFSPDQAKRLVDVAVGEGLLARTDEELRATFDVEAVTVPEEFEPEESILRERSTFERLIDEIVDAGADKREAVAAVNRLQSALGVTVEAAAVLYAHRRGIDVGDHAERVRGEL